MIRASPCSTANPSALLLRADDHRPQLQQLEVLAVAADARLPVEHRAAVLQLHRERAGGEKRARDDEPGAGDRDVERPIHASGSQFAGTPRRT